MDTVIKSIIHQIIYVQILEKKIKLKKQILSWDTQEGMQNKKI